MSSLLYELFVRAAKLHPQRTAIVEPGSGSITYEDLDHLSDLVRDRLSTLGVQPGDRVGMYLRKSIDGIATIYGILKAGAAYVPVDPGAPAQRNAFILHNCAVKVIVTERRVVERFRVEFEGIGGTAELIVLDDSGTGESLRRKLEEMNAVGTAASAPSETPDKDALAYILYTSGSTGKPKGVMLSHENAVSFVDWCSEVFEPNETDRFSSHAPFHFDLSILDIHVALKHGAALVLIGEEIGKDPGRLAALISEQRISCWYSAPSILALLAQYGDLQQYDFGSLRLVLFAGEVFAVKHLRSLTKQLPDPRYFNLYGPTETNVCTFYEVTLPVPDDRDNPYPIGKVCSHLQGKIVDEHGAEVNRGAEGELCISGRGVMQGYWSLPEQTANAYLSDAGDKRWYKTGDIVVEDAGGNLVYVGRRDRMVKRRGYRVELGEIEAGLYRHSEIEEAAVVAIADEEAGIRIRAFLSCRNSKQPSLIAMKRFCSEHLPLYMIPDEFKWCDKLPKTSTDKVDYQRLKEMN